MPLIQFHMQASDVYSFAIIAWRLVSSGSKFFDQSDTAYLYNQVVDFERRPPFPERTDTDLVRLIEACWLADPAMRPSFAQILPMLETMHNKSL